VSQLVAGLPWGPDAAVARSDGGLLVFRGGRCWSASPDPDALTLDEGYSCRATEPCDD